jgi:hypothetical protein
MAAVYRYNFREQSFTQMSQRQPLKKIGQNQKKRNHPTEALPWYYSWKKAERKKKEKERKIIN